MVLDNASLDCAETRRPLRNAFSSRLALLAATRPAREAVRDGRTGEMLTWGGIGAAAHALARAVPARRLVAVCLGDPLRFAETYLAALAAGVCVAPLNPRATPEELERTLAVLGAVDVLVDADSETGEQLSALDMRVWASQRGEVNLLRGRRDGAARVMASGVAEVLATSGTTGAPKRVPLGEAQLLFVAQLIAEHHRLGPLERCYSPLPLFHINAQVVGLLATLVSGAQLIVDDRFRRADTWAIAAEHDATWVNLVPAILAALCDEPPPPDAVAARVRFARSASAPLPLPVLERFVRHTGIGVLETYGLTEAASQVAANPLDAWHRRPGSVGQPVGTAVRVVDEEGVPLPAGALGVVEIAGAGVLDAYLDADGRLIPARQKNGWFQTGDLGRIDDDGFVWLAGRRDDVINRGGELIEPREVEDVLLSHPGVADAAVVARPHPTLGGEPVAFVRAARALDASALEVLVHDLEERCARGLSRFKRPVAIRLVEALPTGSTGKVSRRALAEQLGGTVPAHIQPAAGRRQRALARRAALAPSLGARAGTCASPPATSEQTGSVPGTRSADARVAR